MEKQEALKRVFFFLALTIISPAVFPQENSPAGSKPAPIDSLIPVSVRRPGREETPRYPRDIVIGELDRGNASQPAWLYARDFLNALIRRDKTARIFTETDSALLGRLFDGLEEANPDKYRIGGGRVEEDGAVSFMVRFLGREQSITGEIYLAPQEGEEGSSPWRIDDLILEEAQDIKDIREASRYDFTPYDRFY
ncbi:MAG: hypothetical protein LBH43_03330 [Treponema sp.]|nr:hypothetical protein [Treponema sp.]